MQVVERLVGEAAILTLSGDLMAGSRYRPGALAQQVERVARAGTRLIVVDLANVASADAMGIGEIAEAYKRARLSGANLKLVGPRARVDRLLALANLRTVIEVCDRIEQALGSAWRAEPRASTGSACADLVEGHLSVQKLAPTLSPWEAADWECPSRRGDTW